jgi:hypothetical protein
MTLRNLAQRLLDQTTLDERAINYFRSVQNQPQRPSPLQQAYRPQPINIPQISIPQVNIPQTVNRVSNFMQQPSQPFRPQPIPIPPAFIDSFRNAKNDIINSFTPANTRQSAKGKSFEQLYQEELNKVNQGNSLKKIKDDFLAGIFADPGEATKDPRYQNSLAFSAASYVGLTQGNKARPIISQANNLVRIAKDSDDFVRLLNNAKPEVKMAVEELIKNPRSRVNSVVDFYNEFKPTKVIIKGKKIFDPAQKLTPETYEILNKEFRKAQQELDIDLDLMEDLPRNITGKEAINKLNMGIIGPDGEAAVNIAESLKKAGYEPSTASEIPSMTLRTTGKNQFTNVRSGDNPLIGGQKGMDDWKTNFKPNQDWLDNPLPWETDSYVKKTKPKIDDLKKRYNQIETIEDIFISRANKAKNKVNIIDYFRTPDRVFKKIGMEKESKLLRQKYDDYLLDLPKEIDKVTAWSKRVSTAGNKRIFNYLDGKLPRLDDPEELKVANEIRDYFKEWAKKLDLPEDRQISSYITHIFEKGKIEQEIDPEVAKIIRGKVAKSVYDPFLERRVGQPEYIQDTFRALDAYVKRATRKFHMDQALETIESKADNLPQESYDYIKGRIARINMQPTAIDNLIDNAIKSTPVGYRMGQRPVTSITQTARQWVYRGLLGLNPGSALRNLQQSTNTYALLGERYFAKGLMKTLFREPQYLTGGKSELDEVGVLANNFIQDRNLNATKKAWEKLDNVLFYFFDQAEKFNRSIAYYGAKARALDKGMDEAKAIETAKEFVRKTQFQYDVLDTPAVLQSDLVKTIFQFGRYPLGQAEFLTEMIKSKNVLGAVRFTAANLLFIGAIGEILGLDYKDMLPQFRFGTPPTLQAPLGAFQVATGAKDKYGSEPDENLLNRALENQNLTKGIVNYIPGGGQIKKSIEGYNAVDKGYSETRAGRVRFPVEQSNSNYVRGSLFGQWNLPGAKDYFNEKRTPLGEKQTEEFKKDPTKENYEKIIQKRESDALDDELREKLRTSNQKFLQGNGSYFVKQINGDIRKVKMEAIPIPEATGNTTLDKISAEKYRDDLSTRVNDIFVLGQLQAVPSAKAEDQLRKALDDYNKARALVNTSASGKKPISLEEYVEKREISGLESKINQVYSDYKEGNITLSAANNKLKGLEESLNKAKLASGKKKGRKGKKISIKMVKFQSPKAAIGKSKLPRIAKIKKSKTYKISKAKEPKAYKYKGYKVTISSKPTFT